MAFEQLKTGQINFDCVQGHYIAQLLQMECGKRIETIVEIGTWNGLGSTLCILDGIKDRPYKSFHSLECNKEKLEQARKNLASYLVDDRVHLVWGTVVPREYLSLKVIESIFPDLKRASGESRKILEVDIKNCLASPNVICDLPEKIDFLLLDGGDYTSLQEFIMLLPRCSAYIAMDDTRLEKCYKIREMLCEMPEWNEIYCSQERNGFSVFERV